MPGSITALEFFEASAPEGLEAVARTELRTRLGGQETLLPALVNAPGIVQFTYSGRMEKLLGLQCVYAVFRGLRFAVPRPKALLGHQYFTLLVDEIHALMHMSPAGAYQTLYLAAAGSESTVMQRLAGELADALGLRVSPEIGDLLLRIRPPLDGSPGWEALVRISPRPLSVRAWRVCDLEGALNAAVAHAVILLARPRAEDVFLNLGCGSATLLIERAAAAPSALLLGCDTNPTALACGRANLIASRFEERIQLIPADAGQLPLPPASVDAFAADLPFGLDVGSHLENMHLYPTLMTEAARVARPGARFVLLSQEIYLMRQILEENTAWNVEEDLPIQINGLRSHVYLLRRAKI